MSYRVASCVIAPARIFSLLISSITIFTALVSLSFLALPQEALGQSGLGPECSNAYASPSSVWPPNHKFQRININGVTDDGGNSSVTVQCIKQDEPLNANGDGNFAYDASGIGESWASIRKERQGGSNGRVYHIGFTAENDQGQSCSGVVTVGVPKSKKSTAIDDGPNYDSVDNNLSCVGIGENMPPRITSIPESNASSDASYQYLVVAVDPENDALEYFLTSAPVGMSIDENGLISWVPTASQEGENEVLVRVRDSSGNFDSQRFSIDVQVNSNAAPTAEDLTLSLEENISGPITLIGRDVDGDALTFSLTSLPTLGDLTGEAPNLIYSPFTDAVGVDQFTYRVSDGVLDSNVATVSVTVKKVNSAPVAENQSLSTNEDTEIPILLNASDDDGDSLSYSVVGQPSNGELLGDLPNLVYVPNPEFAGQDSFRFSASDSEAMSNVATVSIDVLAVGGGNGPPVANAGSDQTATIGSTVSLDGTDSMDPDQDDLQFFWTIESSPVDSTAELSFSDIARPTLAADIAGKYVVGLRVGDGVLISEQDTVVLVFDEILENQAPYADAGPDVIVPFDEFAFLNGAGSFDPEGEALTYRWSILGSPEGSDSGFTDPTSAVTDFFGDTPGDYSIGLIVNDGLSDSEISRAGVSIETDPLNLAPTAEIIWTVRFDDFERGLIVELDGSESSDPERDRLTYRWRVFSQDPTDTSELENDTDIVANVLREGFNFSQYFEATYELVVSDGYSESEPAYITVPREIFEPPYLAFDDREEFYSIDELVEISVGGSIDRVPEETTFTWSFVNQSSASQSELASPISNSQEYVVSQSEFIPDVAGTYDVKIIVGFGPSGNIAIYQKRIRVVDPNNEPPIVMINGIDEVTVDSQPVLVTVDGSASFDPDGDNISYTWTLYPPTGSSAVVDRVESSRASFFADVRGFYEIELTVDDGQDTSSYDIEIYASSSFQNSSPIATIVAPTEASVGQKIRLSAELSTDPDNDPLDYYWYIESAPNSSSPVIFDEDREVALFRPDVEGLYTIVLDVGDWDAYDSTQIDINVGPGNIPPTAVASTSQGFSRFATVGNTHSLDGSGSSDSEGAALTYLWEVLETPDGSLAEISGTTSVSPTMTPDIQGRYRLILTVSDGESEGYDEIEFIAFLENNETPVAIVTGPENAAVGSQIILDGTGSYDPDGDQLVNRSWGIARQPPGSIVSHGLSSRDKFSITVNSPGRYIIAHKVGDGMFISAPTFFELLVQGGNSTPVANAGLDQYAIIGESISFNGTRSVDDDNDTLEFSWSIVDAPDGSSAFLQNSASATPLLMPDKAGTYVISLTVFDGIASSDVDTVLVTATSGNTPPIAYVNVEESSITARSVQLDGSESFDAESNDLSFSWEIISGNENNVASLSEKSSPMPLFSALENGEFVVRLVVSDGEFESTPFDYLLSLPLTGVNPVVLDPTFTLTRSNEELNQLVVQAVGLSSPSLDYDWSVVSKPELSTAVVIGDNETETFLWDFYGDYVVSLVVSDGVNTSDTYSVGITIDEPTLQPSEINIVSPALGDVVSSGPVSILGTYVDNLEYPVNSSNTLPTYVEVNGQSACTHNGVFVLNDHPVRDGLNIADANIFSGSVSNSTELIGESNVISSIVTFSGEANNNVEIILSSDCLSVPGVVDFNLNYVPGDLEKIDVDVLNDGNVEFTLTSDQKSDSFDFFEAGLHPVKYTTHLVNGSNFSRLVYVFVKENDFSKQRELIMQTWSGFTDNFLLFEFERASKYFSVSSRDKYLSSFLSLDQKFVTEFSDSLNAIIEIEINEFVATYGIPLSEASEDQYSIVTFLRDPYGVWRISSF